MGGRPSGEHSVNLVTIYNAASGNALLKTHTWGLDLSGSRQGAGGVGGLLGVKEQSGTHAGTYHFAYDANGNITEVLKKNTGSLLAGSLVAHYEYDPFGNTIRSTGAYAAANPFRFSTKYWDPETTFYYYGYRHYDPATGRWPNRDPIEEQGGLNLYGFVGNDPISYSDYLGQNPVKFHCTLCAEADPTSDSKICEVHEGVILRRGILSVEWDWDAKCVCECAGVSDWDNLVRGCLHCAQKEGVEPDEAHDQCYDIATAEYGDLSGWKAQGAIFARCRHCIVE